MGFNNLFKALILVLVMPVGVLCAAAQEAQDTVYTKWKNTTFADLQTGDRVVIADLANAIAISNDNGTKKAPKATSVTFNDEKTRITDSVVTDAIQWTVTVAEGLISFSKPDDATQLLYADAKNGLRVGDNANHAFDMDKDFLHIVLNDTSYYVGVKASFMSSSWALAAEDDGNVSSDISGTEIAFFKKVETTAQDISLTFPYKDYQVDANGSSLTDYNYWFNLEINHDCPEDISDLITFTSSDPDVAEITTIDGVKSVTAQYKKAGSATITAYFPGTEDGKYDDAQATCTVRVEDSNQRGLNANEPLTVAEAMELAMGENPPSSDVCYYIHGKVSKVNSGLLGILGDFGLDDILGDVDLDLDFDLDELGIELPGMTDSNQTTYYVSDDATEESHIKVTKGHGFAIRGGHNNSGIEFGDLKDKDLAVGDDVILYGPLVYSEDSNGLASLLGGIGTGSSTSSAGEGEGEGGESGEGEATEEEEPKKSVKVLETNYLNSINKLLLTMDMNMFVNSTKALEDLYILTQTPEGIVSPAKVSSSDEEVAKWVKNEEGTDSVFTALKEGTAKVTVNIKVTLQEDDPATEDNEEKSYTMKRKFKLNVITRDVEPMGKNAGSYVLAKNISDLHDGDRLVIVGASTTDGEVKYKAMGTDDSAMGGGKAAKDVTISNDTISGVPSGVMEITLERDTENSDIWYLNVGENSDGEKLYLYASDPEEEKAETGGETEPESGSGSTGGEGSGEGETTEGGEDGSDYDIAGLLSSLLGGGNAGLKIGTKAAVGDSCQVAISIAEEGATLKFNVPEKKNTIMMGNALDGLMNLLSSLGKTEDTGETGEGDESGEGSETGEGNGANHVKRSAGSSSSSSGSSSGMGSSSSSYNVSMPTFNCYQENDTTGTLPQIYRFSHIDEYEINIDETHWTTLISDFDVTLPEEEENKLEAFIVTDVVLSDDVDESYLVLEQVESIKGGVPYLLHGVNRDGTFTLEKAEKQNQPSPARKVQEETEKNLLKISDHDTADGAYLLGSNGNGLAGMVRWNEGVTGSGHAYLPEETIPDQREFVPIVSETITAIEDITAPAQKADNRCIDLQGREIKGTPSPGIYIINGKKVIIK